MNQMNFGQGPGAPLDLTCAESNAILLVVLSKHQAQYVRRTISATPRLNSNPGLFIFCSKTFNRTVFFIIFRASNPL